MLKYYQMTRLYINPTLEKSIRAYCELNGIEDINAFANRCAMQGLNILKFGMSPRDNFERENNGIKDIVKNEKKRKQAPQGVEELEEAEPIREDGIEQEVERVDEGESTKKEVGEEKVEPREERRNNVTVRRIKIIKKE